MRTALPLFVGRLFAAASLAAASLAAGAPALAQPPPSLALQQSMSDGHRALELQGQQDLAARQSVLQQNQLTVLDAQIRTQQAIEDVQAQMRTPQVAPPAGGVGPGLDAGRLVSIPDSRLAASNARVKAAAANHH
jgi:hypothetical protein